MQNGCLSVVAVFCLYEGDTFKQYTRFKPKNNETEQTKWRGKINE